MTWKEQAELQLIEKNIKLDPEEAHITFKYPVIGDLNKLGDNINQVIAIERKVESKLIKK